MEFGMPFLIETDTLEDCVALCSRLGLAFIEWNMSFPQCQIAHLSPQKINNLQRQAGIFSTIHLDEGLSVCDFNPRVKRAYQETVLETIALAKEIGAPTLNMHLARGVVVTLPGRKELLFAKYRDDYLQNILEFRQLCEREIGDSGIRIAVENTEGFLTHEQEAIELLLESPCFGLTLDIGHSHVIGDTDIPFYEGHRDRLIHMHAHDARSNKNHLALGDGDIDLNQRLCMAAECNARVVLEVKTIEGLTNSVNWLWRNRD